MDTIAQLGPQITQATDIKRSRGHTPMPSSQRRYCLTLMQTLPGFSPHPKTKTSKSFLCRLLSNYDALPHFSLVITCNFKLADLILAGVANSKSASEVRKKKVFDIRQRSKHNLIVD